MHLLLSDLGSFEYLSMKFENWFLSNRLEIWYVGLILCKNWSGAFMLPNIMIQIATVAEKSGAEVERKKTLHLHSQTFQMLGKMPQRRVLTRGFVCEKAWEESVYT